MNVSKLFANGYHRRGCGIWFAIRRNQPERLRPTFRRPSGVLQKGRHEGRGPGRHRAEIWLVNTAPQGAASGEQNVTLPNVPHGAFFGVVRFPSQGKDRRGQMLKPGIYTLRYSMFPIDGAHQGVAPQRDFLVMSAIGEDQDPKALPSYADLMKCQPEGSRHAAPWRVEYLEGG
jgi:hypothetical protein